MNVLRGLRRAAASNSIPAPAEQVREDSPISDIDETESEAAIAVDAGMKTAVEAAKAFKEARAAEVEVEAATQAVVNKDDTTAITSTTKADLLTQNTVDGDVEMEYEAQNPNDDGNTEIDELADDVGMAGDEGRMVRESHPSSPPASGAEYSKPEYGVPLATGSNSNTPFTLPPSNQHQEERNESDKDTSESIAFLGTYSKPVLLTLRDANGYHVNVQCKASSTYSFPP